MQLRGAAHVAHPISLLRRPSHLQQHVRARLPLLPLVTYHLLDSLVFVPIMLGVLFFLFELRQQIRDLEANSSAMSVLSRVRFEELKATGDALCLRAKHNQVLNQLETSHASTCLDLF